MFSGRKLPSLINGALVDNARLDSPAAQTATVSRRQFIFGAGLVGSALLVGCRMQASDDAAGPADTDIKPTPGSPFEAYIAIAADGIVTVYSSQFDMGQNSYHGLATLVAEELDVPLDKVRVEGRAGNPKWYGNVAMGGALQLTGGSSSMPSSWERYRKAGAVARTLLKQAAAKQWNVAIGTLTTTNGEVIHADSGRRAPYGTLIASAAPLPVPADVALKDAKDWTLIGKDNTARIDAQAKSDGTQPYTIDLQLPGMLVATVLHSPRFGGNVASFDATAAKQVPGVVDVVQISRGVAVVAHNTWAAFKGRDALQVTWDNNAAETRSSEAMFSEFEALSKQDGKVALQRGDAAGKLGKAKRTIEATYRFPYLAHAAMEPLNAVVHKDGDRLHIYGGLQMPDVVQGTCAQIAGVTPEQVDLHVMKTGGGFGRRAVADCDVFVEAVEIAKALDFRAPIKLQWSREADMTAGRYRPLHVHRVRVGLADDGSISGWQHHIVGQSIMAGTPFEALMKDGIDPSSTEGVIDTLYEIADFDLHITHPASPVPVLWWRSVGHTHTAYVMQTMLDEIATATGQDPVALRLSLLPADARERAVLSLAAEKAGWGQPVAAGRYRGVAVHQSFGTYVATVAEVSKTADGGIKVERCVVASDCGIVVNPDVVRAQLQGGTGFGLGAMLGERLTLTDGAATQRNYDSYRPLRIDAMPTVEVHMLPSAASPTGIGEPGVPPIGPAVANAIFQATGKRVRQLPFLQA